MLPHLPPDDTRHGSVRPRQSARLLGLLLLAGISLPPDVTLADPSVLPPPLIIKAVSRGTLVIERQGKIQRYLRLGVKIQQVVQNPARPLAAVFGSAAPRSIPTDYVYIIDLDRGLRRRFALSRHESAWYIDPRSGVWSPRGTYLQLTRFTGRGAMVPEAIIIVRAADLTHWIRGNPWHSVSVKGQHEGGLGPLQPMFFGWITDERFAIEASLPDGMVSYAIYDISSGRYQQMGVCKAYAPACEPKARTQALLRRVRP